MNLEEANTGTGDYNFSIIWRAGVLVEIGISVTCCRCDKRPAWLSLAPHRIKGLEEVILTSERIIVMRLQCRNINTLGHAL